MNSRERMHATLNHKQPDKVVIDFGGTNDTTMNVGCIDELRKYYGLENRLVKVLDVYTLAGIIEADLREAIGADTAAAMSKYTVFGLPRENWKKWTTMQGLEVLVPGGFNTTPDGKGGLYVHPRGDTSAPPSGHLAEGGYYFDAIIRQSPIDEDNLNPEDNVEEYKLFSQQDVEEFKVTVMEGWNAGKSVVLNMPGLGLGDVAEIPGCGLKNPKGIRDLEEWYMAPLLYPDYVKEVFERQTQIGIQNMKMLNDAVGDKIDVIFTSATDFAHQHGTFMSKETFKEFYMPHLKKANDWIHSNTKWKVMFHSCGAVEPFIPMLIDIGVDALNPVQCSADGMDPLYLKKEYGKDIVFWGGGVDTQLVLPFGTPEEVRKQVLKRCEIFAKDGGFVFNSIHNVQAKTPIENITAMINAVHEFNGDKDSIIQVK